jgi:hypothetical protein
MVRARRIVTAVAAGTLLALGLAGGTARSAAEPPPHAAITISSDADFVACGCVTGGAGTASDPYVIGPWTIPAASAGGWALKVDNSSGAVTAHFRVARLNVTYNDLNPAHSVVWIMNVARQTSIANVTASFDGVGVRLDSDANVSISGLELNRLEGDGVQANSSTNVSIVDSKLKTEQSGFHAENSSFIQIGPGCKSACNDWTYDNGRGVWLHNTHDVTARYLTTAAEDTTAMYLDGVGTYNIDIGNSTANSSGSICEVGSGGATGFVVDTDGGIRLVNGAHDNYIHDVTAHGNVAMDIASGGDGHWLNPCTGVRVPISPTTAPMGTGNRFADLCYSLTNIPNLPPSTCKN